MFFASRKWAICFINFTLLITRLKHFFCLCESCQILELRVVKINTFYLKHAFKQCV